MVQTGEGAVADAGGMSEYLDVFLDEADEQVDTLDQGLLRLEKEPDNQDLLQSIFRAAHSLKSASAAMGFADMSRLTHAAENVLDKFRAGEMRPDTAVIDILLAAVDALKCMKESIRGGGADELDVSDVVVGLTAAGGETGGTAVSVAAPEPALAAPQIASDGGFDHQGAHEVVVHLSADCEMRSVRARMILTALGNIGQVLRISPTLEDIAAGRLDRELHFVVASEGGPDAIRRALDSVSEVQRFEVAPDPRVLDVGPGGRGKSRPEIAAMAKRGDQTVRVNVARLDSLMNLVGELVIDRTRVSQLGMDLEANPESADLVQQLKETSAHMARIVGDLQEEVMRARMLPIAQLFQRFPRMVRDLAPKMGKEAELILEGEETELDRSVIEAMVDPLNHLLRNAIDHGVETPEDRLRTGKASKARVILSARQLENHIVIEVTDDGAGIDIDRLKDSAVRKGILPAAAAASLSREDALQLAFAPGLSTADSVSDVSGRGVGMDVVRSNVNRLHGSVRIRTKLGLGTTVAVSLPLTLAISQALLVTVGPAIAAIPLVYVVETARIPEGALDTIQGRLVMLFRGRVLPLVALSEVLQQSSTDRGAEALIRIVATRSGDQEVGLIVDGFVGEQEIVLKPLGSALGDTVGISGATILGNGTVALVLDVASLIDHAGLQATKALSLRQPAATSSQSEAG
jgi:two-component system chemotaxis sensor kinase CheA